jgi:15-cis-phytoene desaturase
VYWSDGHTYYPDSPWAITTVSQARRWLDRPDWEHGYRGVLSIILGRWHQKGITVDKPAWECTPDEIAKEVWYQIRAGLGRSRRLPFPVFWHLDENFHRQEDPTPLDEKAGKRVAGNWVDTYPYQIQGVGLWKKRPGNLKEGYAADYGIVLAGTYMQTHTRVTSMEAANESARHAVNAILRDSDGIRPLVECDTFPIEERELPDLRAARALDAKLHARGLPHAFDILDLDLLAAELFSGSPEDPLNAGTILQKILAMLARSGGTRTGFEPGRRGST